MFGNKNKTDKNSSASNNFRETLLKSGLDVSAFQNGDLKVEKSADAQLSLDFEKEKVVQNSSDLLEKEGTDKSKFSFRLGHILAVAGIICIIILQSIFQFSLFQEENLRLAESSIKENPPIEETLKPETKSENLLINEEIKPQIKNEIRIAPENENIELKAKNLQKSPKNASENRAERQNAPAKTNLRKKIVRESSAERLRRAEKILTGV